MRRLPVTEHCRLDNHHLGEFIDFAPVQAYDDGGDRLRRQAKGGDPRALAPDRTESPRGGPAAGLPPTCQPSPPPSHLRYQLFSCADRPVAPPLAHRREARSGRSRGSSRQAGDHLSPGVTLLQVGDRRGDLLERIAPVDLWAHVAGLDQLRKERQVLGGHMRRHHGDILAAE